MTISGKFERFQYFNFETNFLENETFFKKLEYRFLVESTKIENASFPYKIVISEANVKRNSMVSTKWTYHKERSFASNYFIFSKVLFQFNPFKTDKTATNDNLRLYPKCKPQAKCHWNLPPG